MRFLPRVFLGVLVALFFFPSLAHAQWSGTGPVYTNDNVGIGTSSPRSPLDIDGSIFTTGSLFIEDEGASSNLWLSQGEGKTKLGEVDNSIQYQKTVMTLDLASGEVGVGTGDPTSTLDVHGDIRLNDDALWLRPNNDESHGLYLSRTGSEQGTFAGDDTDGPALFGYDGGILGTTGSGGERIILKWTASGRVGIGTPSPSEKLSVNGKVRSKEVIVENSNWPDFVFEPGYDLRSLDVVDAFVDANGHLPGVPNASDVAQSGQHVGATQATLLQKIEELTLYAIDQHERAETLRRKAETLQSALDAERARNDKQQKQIDALREAVQQLD